MSETEMSTQVHSLENLPVCKYETADEVLKVTSQSAFLPYLQLFAGTAQAVNTGKIPKGHFGVVQGENITDLGKEFDCYPLSMRFKAMRFGDPVIVVYNPKDPEYAKILAESNIKGQMGAMCGMEFLLFLPNQDVYVLYHMANNSARQQAPNMRAQLGKPTTVASKLTHNKKMQYWDVPDITACQVPLDQPEMGKASELINVFQNPPEPKIETASAEEVAATGRAR